MLRALAALAHAILDVDGDRPSPFEEVIAAHAGETPVPIFDVVRETGIDLRFVAGDDEELCGDAYGRLHPAGDGWRMLVDRDRSLPRQRHAAATLLAHHVHHRDLLGWGVVVGPDPGALVANRMNGIEARHRTQAHQVAANLLMPRRLVAGLGEAGVEGMAARLGVTPAALRIWAGLGQRRAT